MLTVTIPSVEKWNEKNNEFVHTKSQTLQLEHSLVSISKWESRWNKPFLSREEKTSLEILDYIRCMTTTQNISDEVYENIPTGVIQKIINYISLPMTATTFREDDVKGKKEVVTSEIIYYWMVTLNIPFECQKWHLNRLLTLIRVCNIKNQPKKKINKKDLISRNARLNAARKKKLNSKG